MARNITQTLQELKDKGYSDTELSQISGIPKQTISRWRRTKRFRNSLLGKLLIEIEKIENVSNKDLLSNATLENIAERAKELGYSVTFTNIGV